MTENARKVNHLKKLNQRLVELEKLGADSIVDEIVEDLERKGFDIGFSRTGHYKLKNNANNKDLINIGANNQLTSDADYIPTKIELKKQLYEELTDEYIIEDVGQENYELEDLVDEREEIYRRWRDIEAIGDALGEAAYMEVTLYGAEVSRDVQWASAYFHNRNNTRKSIYELVEIMESAIIELREKGYDL